jgi:two-component system response regulator MtrA
MIESSILIVCDEPTTSRVWGLLLTDLRCRPIVTNTVSHAITALEESAPDVIVVDVTSGDANGVQICRSLREHSVSPMLFFTPINNETHMLEAYQAGVDDCIIKPVSPVLFLAKIKVWLNRSWTVKVESLDKLTVGEYTLDPTTHHLSCCDGRKIRLSNLEFRVLYLLVDHPNQVFSNDEIIDRVWGFHGEGNSVLVKNLIYRLRKKIEPNSNQAKHIQTEMGGYVFRK